VRQKSATARTSSSLTKGPWTAHLLAARHVEHVALAEQLLGALLAEDGAAVDLRCDREADPGRKIRLDDAGDDVDRGALRRHYEVDAGRARLLRQSLDQELDFLAGGHHQVGKLVHHHHDLRQRLVLQLLHLVLRLAALGIVAGLDPPSERLPFAFASRTFALNEESWRTPTDAIIR
jgi:hypothetical protein